MDLLGLIILAGVVGGYWMSGLRAREYALRAARRACEQQGVQLLDESVAQNRVRLGRDGSGRLCWQRRFGFEFSDDGGSRRDGEVELLGIRTIALRLSLPDHTLHQVQ